MGSSTILFALLEHRVRKMSRMEGRGAPMIFAPVFTAIHMMMALTETLGFRVLALKFYGISLYWIYFICMDILDNFFLNAS